MKKVISDTEQDYLRSHVQKNEEASIITRILAIRKYVRPPSVEILDEFEKELDKTFRMIDLERVMHLTKESERRF